MAKRKRRALQTSSDCPCGSGRPYAECCQRLHDDSWKPTTAEQVMRARYTAHVVGHTSYLQRSWHPDTRPDHVAMSDSSERWLGLDVVDIQHGAALDAEGFVEFKARFKMGTQLRVLHERSHFVRLGGQWVYYDGEIKF